MKYFLSLGFLFFAPLLAAQVTAPEPPAAELAVVLVTPGPEKKLETYKIIGLLREKGTKKRLAGVNIFILPQKIKAITDAKGHFNFEPIEKSKITFVVNLPGYQKLEKEVDLKSDIEVQIYAEKDSYQSYETTITDKATRKDVVVKTLTRQEFLTMPGANGDPVKAVQNLPGVARTGFSSQVIIQGSGPRDTAYLLDDHVVPLVFHFGGLTSVVMPEEIDSVDYLSAGFGPEYSSAMGGVIGLHTKTPSLERMKGIAFVDTIKSGGLIEGPINDHSSYLVSGRYSYLGFVLAAALKGNDQFDLTVAPSFYDFSAIYANKTSAEDDFKLTTITSHDELKFIFKQPLKTDPSVRGTFDNETSFFRIIPQWSHKFSEETQGKISMGLGSDAVKVDFGSNFFQVATINADLRAEVERKYSSSWVSSYGVDSKFMHSDYSFQLPSFSGAGGIPNPISSAQTIAASLKRDDIDPGLYFKNTIDLFSADNKLIPSLRFDYFSQTHQPLLAPRISDRLQVNESLVLKAASGLYYQPPQPQEIDSSYGNPNLTAPYAYHLAFGLEKDFRENQARGFVLTTGPFYRNFQNLVVQSSKINNVSGVLTPERYNNSGSGEAYGLEVLLKWQAKAISTFVSYTLSRSTRTDSVLGTNSFQYDQTHNLIWVASYDSRNWKYSTRLRYVTGNPDTPVVSSIYDSDNDVYIPVRGAIYSTRFSPFISLDTRIDKKWIYDTWILSAYLDVQNLTNNKNPESITYSYNYAQSQTVNGLPLLPTLGVQGEF
jgi:hypothetical protein